MRAALDDIIETWNTGRDRKVLSDKLRALAADARALSDRLVLGRVRTSTFDTEGGHRSGWTKWTALKPGDRLVFRGKRYPVEGIVTVDSLLEQVLGDGRGFVGDDGRTYRQFYFDIAYILSEDP